MEISKDSSAKHYEDNKERLKKKACERDQSLSKEEKEKKKWQYGHEWYKNLPENKKQKLVEHRKKYYKMKRIASP